MLDLNNIENNINSSDEALESARQILMEMFTENATLLGVLREYVLNQHKPSKLDYLLKFIYYRVTLVF